MSVTGVRVRIYDEGKCIHEHETVRSDGNDLGTLMRNLRDTQSEVNDFLTALIQRQNTSDGAQETANRSIPSDIESDSVEDEDEREREVEVEVAVAVEAAVAEHAEEEKEEEEEEEVARANPKKCKFT